MEEFGVRTASSASSPPPLQPPTDPSLPYPSLPYPTPPDATRPYPTLPNPTGVRTASSRRSQFKNNYLAEMWSGSEEGSYVRLKDCCITQL